MKLKNIVIFASGNGSNFEAIASACCNGEIDASISLLVCDKIDAYVIERAAKYNIKTLVIQPCNFYSRDEYEAEIVRNLSLINVDLICLAGYMRIVGNNILNIYQGKIINIHPSLLPSFKGMRAIEQAMDYGVKVYGATIHYVDKSLDGGKIIDQESFYYSGRDIDSLKNKLSSIEHKLYVSVVKKLLS